MHASRVSVKTHSERFVQPSKIFFWDDVKFSSEFMLIQKKIWEGLTIFRLILLIRLQWFEVVLVHIQALSFAHCGFVLASISAVRRSGRSGCLDTMLGRTPSDGHSALYAHPVVNDPRDGLVHRVGGDAVVVV